MKKLLFALLIAVSLVSTCAAFDIKLAWDLVPGETWDNVRIYEKAGTTYTLKQEVAGTLTLATLTGYGPGSYVFIARAVKSTIESADSNTASATVKPSPIPNLRIVAVVIDNDGKVNIMLLDPSTLDLSGFFRT